MWNKLTSLENISTVDVECKRIIKYKSLKTGIENLSMCYACSTYSSIISQLNKVNYTDGIEWRCMKYNWYYQYKRCFEIYFFIAFFDWSKNYNAPNWNDFVWSEYVFDHFPSILSLTWWRSHSHGMSLS